MMRSELEGHANTLAFVIMPDHLHWLIQLTGSRSLAQCIGAVKSESARRINEHSGRKNPVWQRGFYERSIRREDDIVDVARYIIANPVRAGIVRSARQYALWDTIWI
jgi:REP element-mobilizing transposase RayT